MCFGKKYVGRPLRMDTEYMNMFLSPVNAKQKATTTEATLNNK